MKILTLPMQRLLALTLVVAFSSCSKEKSPQDVIYDVRGTASSVNLQNSTGAYGNIFGGFSTTGKKIAFKINWYNLGTSATGTSIRMNDANGNDIVVKQFPVTEGTTAGLTAGEMNLSEEQAIRLLNGDWSYSVNTVDHPDGELRGKMQVSRSR